MNQASKVVVVDPYSAGALYAPEFAKHGRACIALQSADYIPPHFAGDLDPSMFVDVYGSVDRFTAEVQPGSVLNFVAGCDTGAALSDTLAARYRVPGNDPATSDSRRLKHAMHEALRAYGVRYIKSQKFGSLREFEASGHVFPDGDYIIKPINSAGSEGVRFARGHASVAAELASAAWEQRNVLGDVNDGFVVQDFVSGVEHVVDLVSNGDDYFICSTCRYRKTFMNGSRFVYLAMELLNPDDPALDPLLTYAKQAARALGIRIGPVHMELMWDADGPVMIEAGARPHGAGAPNIFAEVYEPGLIDAAVRSYLGLPLPGQSTSMRREGRTIFLTSQNDALFAGFDEDDLAALSRLSSYRGHRLYVLRGERLSKTIDLATCPGVVFLAHDDVAILDRDEAAIRVMLKRHFGMPIDVVARR